MARGKELALTFGKAAEDYERGRPGYPAEALDWIFSRLRTGSGTIDAVDIGAGTGKFTRALAARNIRLTAVEPDDVMRQTLSANLPAVRAFAGTAESIPAPADSFDLATLAQAWHWVDSDAASVEVARVLCPGGLLALVWNIRDESVDWVARLGEVIGSSAAEEFDNVNPPIGEPLHREAYAEFRWNASISREEIFAMVTSRSYIIAVSDDDRRDVLDRVGKLLDEHPQVAGLAEFSLPYITRVTIARR